MSDATIESLGITSLLLDLLEWLARGDQRYEDVMDAWRTSCPKLPVWEEANDRGFITKGQTEAGCMVKITPAGLAFLDRERPNQGKT